jgi:hypothetical protein
MKVNIELNYQQENEPSQFKSIENIQTRKVYLWSDYRGILENENWRTQKRESTTNNETDIFMEVWSDTNEENNPPADPDDCWTETYKTISLNSIIMEWHPELNIWRICWSQSANTLKDHKIMRNISECLKDESLILPNFPDLHL